MEHFLAPAVIPGFEVVPAVEPAPKLSGRRKICKQCSAACAIRSFRCSACGTSFYEDDREPKKGKSKTSPFKGAKPREDLVLVNRPSLARNFQVPRWSSGAEIAPGGSPRSVKIEGWNETLTINPMQGVDVVPINWHVMNTGSLVASLAVLDEIVAAAVSDGIQIWRGSNFQVLLDLPNVSKIRLVPNSSNDHCSGILVASTDLEIYIFALPRFLPTGRVTVEPISRIPGKFRVWDACLSETDLEIVTVSGSSFIEWYSGPFNQITRRDVFTSTEESMISSIALRGGNPKLFAAVYESGWLFVWNLLNSFNPIFSGISPLGVKLWNPDLIWSNFDSQILCAFQTSQVFEFRPENSSTFSCAQLTTSTETNFQCWAVARGSGSRGFSAFSDGTVLMADLGVPERYRSQAVVRLCQARFQSMEIQSLDEEVRDADKFKVATEKYENKFNSASLVEISRSDETSSLEKFPIRRLAACETSGLVAFGGYAGLIFLVKNL